MMSPDGVRIDEMMLLIWPVGKKARDQNVHVYSVSSVLSMAG